MAATIDSAALERTQRGRDAVHAEDFIFDVIANIFSQAPGRRMNRLGT